MVASAGFCSTTIVQATQKSRQATRVPTPEWSCFRGPNGSGKTDATGLPLEWDANSNIAWKCDLPGPGASSPIVFGDHIYVTCYTGFFVPGDNGTQDKLQRHLLKISIQNGSVVWDKTVKAKLPEEETIRDHGFAASTPAADADGVVVFYGKTGVIAFDHMGNEVWRADVGDRTHQWGSSASPVLHKGLVFINASVESGSLVALERSSGKEVWRSGGINEAWNTPVIAVNRSGSEELIVATQGKILSFRPSDGKALWSCDTGISWYMAPSVVADEGIVYAIGGRSGIAGLAVRTGGSGDVTKSHWLWNTRKGSNVSSPVHHEGLLYYVSDSRETAYCADEKTGEIRYEERLPRGDQFYASALLGDGRVYYLNRRGKTFVLRLGSKYELLATNDLDDGSTFNASFAVHGKQLLLRSDKRLYCIGSS